MMTYNW